MQFRFVNVQQLRDDPRFGAWQARVNRHPSWVWKIAGTVAALVIIVPIVVLILLALFAFMLVFAVLSVVAALGNALSGAFGGTGGTTQPASPRDDGRRNVRVIRSE